MPLAEGGAGYARNACGWRQAGRQNEWEHSGRNRTPEAVGTWLWGIRSAPPVRSACSAEG
jgi:hypothetical protein